MLRLILALLTAAFMMQMSQEQLLRNSSSFKQACAQGYCATGTGDAASAEKPVTKIHSLEQSAYMVLLGISLVLMLRFKPTLHQFVSTAWTMVICCIVLLTGLALLFEGAADGLQQQFGYHASAINSLELSCGFELVSIIALFGALVIGPPRGWSGDEELELL